MNLLALVPLRVWLIAAAVSALGLLLWHDHHLSKLYKAEKAEKAAVIAALESERTNRKTEHEDRQRADTAATSLQAELDRIRAEPRITGVRICPHLPRAASQGGAAAIADGPTAERVEGVLAEDPAGLDVSEGLDEYATNCAATAATLSALQAWEVGRSH